MKHFGGVENDPGKKVITFWWWSGFFLYILNHPEFFTSRTQRHSTVFTRWKHYSQWRFETPDHFKIHTLQKATEMSFFNEII